MTTITICKASLSCKDMVILESDVNLVKCPASGKGGDLKAANRSCIAKIIALKLVCTDPRYIRG